MEDVTGGSYAGVTPSDHADGGGEDEAAERRHLLVFSGSSSWIYPLPLCGDVVIGRSETADLRIDHGAVSRRHARLMLEGDIVSVLDLGSHNGTYVNHGKITGRRTLHPNDVITIHNTTLVYHATPVVAPSVAVVELDVLRGRIEDELDRTMKSERLFSLLCFANVAVGERGAVQRAVIAQLRRIDAVAWSTTGALYVLLPEAGADEAIAVATRIRNRLDRATLQIGHVSCPDDGYDADALIARVAEAAKAARPGKIAGLEHAFHTLTIGAQRVIVADPTVGRLYALIERLAPVGLPVLITGETGTGKELIATAIHTRSQRGGKQLISLNCAALHEALVESELFGHERGAFSGAIATRAGLVEAASGSTLFLDEVGELAPQIQAKLLRVLESHRVTRVGDVRERDVDVRIVAATNRDLEADVATGRFRRDLYFRLSAATLHLPPLRHRPRELPLLAAAFLEDACRRSGREAMQISDEAMAVLLAHGWPGNVRELKHLMQYVAATLAVDVLRADHLGERLGRLRPEPSSHSITPVPRDPLQFRPLADELRELEITRIREAIEAAGGNQTRAAGLLAMPVRTFFEKAKLYGLTPKRKRYDH
jgi:DNA-binding NtrC family response regulator/pSer/pThr/pTyr-binding forkhead associated (FHA) protein